MTTAEDSLASAGEAGVSQSLEGLVGALDKLKQSLGYGDEFALVEQHIQELQQENDELRQFAETAIMEAQRLKEMNHELEERLGQVALEESMGAVLAETAKLRDVADEFERDLIEEKVLEAEVKNAEIEALKERVQELEDENEGLTQTLNEFRQTTQQLQRLQSHEVRRLQRMEKRTPGPAGGVAPIPESGVYETGELLAAGPDDADSPRAPASSSNSPKSSLDTSVFPAAAAAALAGAATGATVSAAVRSSVPSSEAERIAADLEEVSAGDKGGLLASAARTLREYAIVQADLAAERQEADKLRVQVAELNDTMFSKTFKPPSAWAEREIKYKTDKKAWEEHQKEMQERIAALRSQIEGLKGSSGAHDLEARIEDLEARLLQSEREKDNLRAQLHETQLSMRQTGEFGNAGVRLSPYKPEREAVREGEVYDKVHRMEEAHIGMQSPAVASVAATADRLLHLEAQLAKADQEKAALRAQLAELRPVVLPPSLHKAMGPCVPAALVESRASALEHDLEGADAEAEQLARELRELQAAMQGLSAAGAAGAGSRHPAMHAFAAPGIGGAGAAVVALPQQPPETVLGYAEEEVAELQARLEEAEQRSREVAEMLEEVQPVLLQIQTEAAERPTELISVPIVLREALGREQAPAADVEAAATQLQEQAAAAKAQATALADQLQQVQQLQAWLRQAEEEKAQLRQKLEDLQPVQLQINAAMKEAEATGESPEQRLISLTIAVPESLQDHLGDKAPAAQLVATVARLEHEQDTLQESSASLAEQLQQVLLVSSALDTTEQQRRQAEEDLQALQAAQRQAVQQQQAAGSTAGGSTAGAPGAIPEAAAAPAVVVSLGGQKQSVELDQAAEQARRLQAKLAQLRSQELSLHSELSRAHRLQLQLRQADAEKRNLQAELAALEPAPGIVPPTGTDVSAEPSHLDAADKAAAVAQLKEELARAEATAAGLREQLHQQAGDAPVCLGISVFEAAVAEQAVKFGINLHDAAAAVQQVPASAVRLGINVEEAAAAEERVKFGITVANAQQPVRMAINVNGETLSGAAAAERAQQLEARLLQAEQERAALRQQLAELQPVRLQLQVRESAGRAAGGAALTSASLLGRGSLDAERHDGLTELRELSESSMVYSPEQASALARDRAEADAAWDAHLKSSDLPALRRAKAELETRCQMLEAQVGKMSSALAQADQDKAAVEQGIESAMATGDVALLASLKERLRASAQSSAGSPLPRQTSAPSTSFGIEKSIKKMGTMFKRGSKQGATPSKDSLKSALHEVQEALAASEQERNVLKRQLAKLSKKYQQATVNAAHTAGIVAGAHAMAAQAAGGEPEENGHGDGGSSVAEGEGAAPLAGSVATDDNELELMKLREENQMLMEHLVMNKVRLAETEGDYLESKRALLRAREKQLALVKKINELRSAFEAGAPMPASPSAASMHTLTPQAATSVGSRMGTPGMGSY